jgi:tRNA(Ile)-lysidine synthase
MIEKVYKTIKKYHLLDKGDCVVVAHSGGPDSTALLNVLFSIAGEMHLQLIVAHFNHGLRGKESDNDEKHSRDLARKYGLIFCGGTLNKKMDSKGISPEDFYRRQRYDFLVKTAQKHCARKIALGHNLNDQAETVLLNFLRGSGLEGLKGILPKRNDMIVRPLIEISKPEIISFLDQSKMKYRRDSSNKENKYLRNKIRNELIPYLKEKYNPKIEENLSQMAHILRVEDEFIKQHVAEALKKSVIRKSSESLCLNVDVVKKLPEAIRWRLFKTILEDLTPSNNGISFAHVISVDDLVIRNESGRKVSLPSKIEARREYHDLILEKKEIVKKPFHYEYVLNIPGSVYVPEKNVTVKGNLSKRRNIRMTNSNRKIYLDWDRINPPIRIRNRREGDWFQPLGMTGRQKIKKYFIDHKLPSAKRDNIMLLADDLSVIYIERMSLNDRVKITPKTKNVLKLEIQGV